MTIYIIGDQRVYLALGADTVQYLKCWMTSLQATVQANVSGVTTYIIIVSAGSTIIVDWSKPRTWDIVLPENVREYNGIYCNLIHLAGDHACLHNTLYHIIIISNVTSIFLFFRVRVPLQEVVWWGGVRWGSPQVTQWEDITSTVARTANTDVETLTEII